MESTFWIERSKLWTVLGTFLCWVLPASGESESGLVRVANSQLNLPLLPQLFDYHMIDAFPQITFERPVRITAPVGERDRLFVVEQGGRIILIQDLDRPRASVFLDLSDRTVSEEEAGLLNLAFHPEFQQNGFFFVFYTLNDISSQGAGLHDRLSRFQVMADDPDQADVASEAVLINQFDRHLWHNAGGLAFGPDGYLYLTVGDEGSGSDGFDNSQRIDGNFFSGMLRIDVDMKPGNRLPNPHPASIGHYLIPADNPFIGKTSFKGKPINPTAVRTEFYAIGLRNAWRFCFDSKTGRLYCNDTGEVTREEVNLISSGGNYGWAYWEGKLVGPKWSPGMEAGDYEAPLVEYGRELGNGVAGGLLYRGSRVPELDGSYIFSDFWNGFIGRFHYDGNQVSEIEWLLWDSGITDIDVNPATGSILVADWFEGRIKQLVPGPDPRLPPLPQRLSGTGLFQNLEDLTPSEGLIPYEINVPFWSDNAIKRRWFCLPDPKQKFSLLSQNEIHYPAGAIWVKQFDLELKPGDPSSVRRLETRVLVQTPAGVPYGATYRWGDSLTDAELVPASGLEESFTIKDEEGDRVQVWRYPSRRECFSCHNSRSSGVLGFTPAQLNREMDYGCGSVFQLQAMSDAGYFWPVLGNVHNLPALARLDDPSHSLEYRVRSYLEANCVSCHRPGGVATVPWDARITARLDGADLLDGKPSNHLGDPEGRVISPGSLEHSILFRRISQPEVGRMPPLASSVLDQQAIDLVREWITSELPERSTFSDWQSIHFPSENDPLSLADADADNDLASNLLEFLTATDPLSSDDRWRISVQLQETGVRIRFQQLPNRRYEVQWTEELHCSALWLPLDVPDNRPFVSAAPFLKTVEDSRPHARTRFYRVVVYEH
ncbi:MAG: Quinoprotein glucose dehydrogenase B [Verrucomicrobia subdivision 3 bacterium]|nr:Quinoprotein glucose dehydrogenase B [Limisphaerales bacterium]MCS1414843.1 Quinoprotein glucose dehydrogenase B [Limisphaerales bacterium]